MWTRITGLIDTWRNPMAEFKKRLLLVITGLFVLSTVVVAATKAKSKKDSAAEKDEEPVAVKVDTSGGGGKVSAEKIVRRGKRATALVEVPVKRGTRTGTGYASAFCIHETGLFLTNHHVVEKAPAEGVERENLERIAREAERCKSIVQGLLDFARQREPAAETLNINTVVNKALALLTSQSLFHNIEVATDLGLSLPLACVDASQMQQVFVNIIMNAAEAMAGKGILTITSRVGEGGNIEVSFRDTGCGIPREDLDCLFEPFFTTKEVGRGTGLGLSISHGIVKSHGGELNVTSQIGQGTEFVISLPPAQKET